MRLKQDQVVDLLVNDARIEPHRDDDPQVVGFLFRNVARSHGVEDSVGDRGLHSSHQDVRVFLVVDRDLTDHHRHRPDLHVAVQNREDLRVPLRLIANQIGDRVPNRAVQFADDNFGLGSRPGGGGFDEGFSGAHHNSLTHGGPFGVGVRIDDN